MKMLEVPSLRLLGRRHPPGTAPGTLPVGVEPAAHAHMRLVRYDLESINEAELASPADLEQLAPDQTFWIDIEGHDVTAIGDLGARLAVHPLALEDVINVGQRPKVEDYQDSLFVVLDHFFVVAGSSELEREQVSVVVQPGLVLSVRERASAIFEPVLQRLRNGPNRIRGAGAGYLAYTLIDTVVDQLFPVLEWIGERIEEVEMSTLERPEPGDLASIHLLKRELLLLRKSMWPLRDMLSHLLRSDSRLISDETRLYLRDVADHAARALDIVETYRDMVGSLMDLYLSSVSNRMNEAMKVLTVIATIFIPLGFIAGLYGMNFDPGASPLNMPELRWRWGYPFALALMAGVAGGLLLYFRRRRWI